MRLEEEQRRKTNGEFTGGEMDNKILRKKRHQTEMCFQAGSQSNFRIAEWEVTDEQRTINREFFWGTKSYGKYTNIALFEEKNLERVEIWSDLAKSSCDTGSKQNEDWKKAMLAYLHEKNWCLFVIVNCL